MAMVVLRVYVRPSIFIKSEVNFIYVELLIADNEIDSPLGLSISFLFGV